MRKHDHTDHSRTTQPRAGQWMKNGRGLPGVLVMLLGVLPVVLFVVGAAYDSPVWAGAMGVAAVSAFAAGAAWVFLEGRRIGRFEVQWRVEHPNGPTPGCTDPKRCQYFAKLGHPMGHSPFCSAPQAA